MTPRIPLSPAPRTLADVIADLAALGVLGIVVFEGAVELFAAIRSAL